jgi:hypothetical protein
MEQIVPTVIAFITGGSLTAIIVWLRFRKVDSATARKTHAEAQSIIHSSDASALNISTELVMRWMKAASDSETKISEQKAEISALKMQLLLCICGKTGNGK